MPRIHAKIAKDLADTLSAQNRIYHMEFGGRALKDVIYMPGMKDVGLKLVPLPEDKHPEPYIYVNLKIELPVT